MGAKIAISGTWPLTPADRRVYARKLFHALLVVTGFIVITYYITGDYERAGVIASVVTAVVAVVLAFVVAIAGVLAGAFVLAVLVLSVGENAGVGAFVVALLAAFVDMIMFGLDEKYKISPASNFISAGIQFLLIWGLLYVGAHL